MKKLLSIILSTFMMLMTLSVVASASDSISENDEIVVSTETVYLDDGSTLTITTKVNQHQFVSNMATYASSGSRFVSGNKEVKNEKDGELIWKYVLTGEYTVVDGVSSVCTNAYYTYTINDSKWSINDPSTSYSDNVAYGYCVFKKKVLFITTNTITVDISLTCDVNGVLS